eukprot:748648-Hanusia_phi.AAC.2
MKKVYDESKCTWSDEIKYDELVDHGGAARFLLVYQRDKRSNDERKPVGFVHFRFTLQGEPVGAEAGEPALYVMDIQLEEHVRRKGLGTHLMRAIEMIARQQRMMHILIPVVKEDRDAKSFVLNGMRGFAEEHLGREIISYDGQQPAKIFAADKTFLLFSKRLLLAPSNASNTAARDARAADDQLSAASTPQKKPGPCDHVDCSCSDDGASSEASSEELEDDALPSVFKFELDMSRSISTRLSRPGAMAEALKNL